ncbi:MAG: hypothetical protein LBK82_10305 [Planctomycetaceae bacterium]|nr:hypothetical protein [Planctomycetaceae bacterium]
MCCRSFGNLIASRKQGTSRLSPTRPFCERSPTYKRSLTYKRLLTFLFHFMVG